jgi:hypothetical protein
LRFPELCAAASTQRAASASRSSSVWMSGCTLLFLPGVGPRPSGRRRQAVSYMRDWLQHGRVFDRTAVKPREIHHELKLPWFAPRDVLTRMGGANRWACTNGSPSQSKCFGCPWPYPRS